MKEEIKQYAWANGVTAASQQYKLSPFIIRKLVGWNKDEQKAFLARVREQQKETRKKRRKEQLDRWNNLPKVKEKRLKWTKRWRNLHILASLASPANCKYGFLGRVSPLDLWGIAKRQKMICPYSGQRLTADNVSLEHIIPISRGGTHTKDNVRLVHMWANLMKLNCSLEDFKKMIACIHYHLNKDISLEDIKLFNAPSPLRKHSAAVPIKVAV
jgi:hypothetical protein